MRKIWIHLHLTIETVRSPNRSSKLYGLNRGTSGAQWKEDILLVGAQLDHSKSMPRDIKGDVSQSWT